MEHAVRGSITYRAKEKGYELEWDSGKEEVASEPCIQLGYINLHFQSNEAAADAALIYACIWRYSYRMKEEGFMHRTEIRRDDYSFELFISQRWLRNAFVSCLKNFKISVLPELKARCSKG